RGPRGARGEFPSIRWDSPREAPRIREAPPGRGPRSIRRNSDRGSQVARNLGTDAAFSSRQDQGAKLSQNATHSPETCEKAKSKALLGVDPLDPIRLAKSCESHENSAPPLHPPM